MTLLMNQNIFPAFAEDEESYIHGVQRLLGNAVRQALIMQHFT
jgi:hypothetical protein